MFKLAWAAIVSGNPGSWAILALGIIVTLGVASGTGAYVMHKIDSADYKALQLSYAQAQNKSKDARIAAQQDFDKQLAQANKDKGDAIAELARERAAHAQSLHDVLAAEGKKNASLDICLRTKLPASVLQQLTR